MLFFLRKGRRVRGGGHVTHMYEERVRGEVKLKNLESIKLKRVKLQQ